MELFEANLKDNLYRVWNRMSSGSYMPPAIRLVREQTQNKACYRVQDREHDVQGESDALPQKPQRAADKIAYVRVPAVAAGQSWQQQHLTDSSSLEGGVGLGGVLQRQSPIDRNDEFAGGHRVGHVKKSIDVLL